jgi:hypothetical protein
MLLYSACTYEFVVDMFKAQMWRWAEERNLFLIQPPVVHFFLPEIDSQWLGVLGPHLEVRVIARAVPMQQIPIWGTEGFAIC